MSKVLDFSRPHLIRDVDEYEAAVDEIGRILEEDPVAGTEDYERLEFLSLLVHDYEDRHVPMPMGEGTTPQDIVDFVLEQKGLTRADLHEPMGGRSRVSEFFTGKRSLSKAQIDSLRAFLGIPADLLLG